MRLATHQFIRTRDGFLAMSLVLKLLAAGSLWSSRVAAQERPGGFFETTRNVSLTPVNLPPEVLCLEAGASRVSAGGEIAFNAGAACARQRRGPA